MARIPGQFLLLSQMKSELSTQTAPKEVMPLPHIHVPLVKNISDIGQMVTFTTALDIVLHHRPIPSLRILEGVIGMRDFFIYLILGQPDILFDDDEEGEMQTVLTMQDHEAWLFLTHVVFVL